ncbi:putative Cutinase [Seiridium unicorne]|uniref:Cutinase n=1 Tax=Seiridium unicorne TaxID=138068 RepID=A0ABR2V180_9PEZI
MQSFIIVLALALAISVSGTPVPASTPLDVEVLEVRQSGDTTENEFYDDGCRDVILFFARGTDQPGNVGDNPGPQLVSQLKAALGDDVVAAQGINYPAVLVDNLYTERTNPEYPPEMAANITLAATQCPDAQLVVSGYSQGAAMVHDSVSTLSDAVKAQIAAAVTFGDTLKEQDGGQIPNFDPSKTLIICNTGDEVCNGTLIITSAHLDYSGSVPEAVSFIQSKLA